MGLDITHYKATLKKPAIFNSYEGSYMTEEEFEYFDVDFDYFKDCTQKIDIPKVLRTLIFPKKESDIDEVKEWFKNSHNDLLFEKNLGNINASIEHFMKNKQLTENLFCTWDAGKWIGADIFTFEEGYGFYYEEVGYQRKGVNKNFWGKFCTSKIQCFTSRKNFEFALSCVDYYWHEDTEEDVVLRKQEFKRDFVDKYEPHKSWLEASY